MSRLQQDPRLKWPVLAHTIRVVRGLFVIILALCLSPFTHAAELSPAAGPRTGTVLILEVVVPDRAAMNALVEGGYNISGLSGDRATVFATPGEARRLAESGYTIVEKGRQPSPPSYSAGAKGLGAYHNYASLTTELQAYADAHPGIARLFTLGQSVEGRELWALLITDNPDVEEEEPEFKYVSSIHGSEPVGLEMCLYLIDLMLNQYGFDTRITDLVDSTAIWIVPSMNPDGLEWGTRNNADGFDLNRSFPDFPTDYTATFFDGEPLGEEGRPPEVAHVMQWTAGNSFVLSANLHTGALVANYPYDHEVGIPSGADAPSPDELLFRELSLRYAVNNPEMYASTEFENGITNGSAWYAITGGMQDWNYRFAGCNEITLELSITHRPAQSQLPGLWTSNQEAMLSYMEAVHIGVRGVITDRAGGAPLWAKVTVEGNAQPVFSDADVGDFYRLLLPGTYTLAFSAPGFITWREENVVVTEGGATRLDVALAGPDIDGDGFAGATDLQHIINHILGAPCPFDCDLDGGGVTSTDLQAVINAIVSQAKQR